MYAFSMLPSLYACNIFPPRKTLETLDNSLFKFFTICRKTNNKADRMEMEYYNGLRRTPNRRGSF